MTRPRSAASLATQPEAARKRPQLKLRLRPEVAADMRARAREAGVTLSALVEAAWAAYAGS